METSLHPSLKLATAFELILAGRGLIIYSSVRLNATLIIVPTSPCEHKQKAVVLWLFLLLSKPCQVGKILLWHILEYKKKKKIKKRSKLWGQMNNARSHPEYYRVQRTVCVPVAYYWLKMTGKAYCAGFVTGTLSMALIENTESAGCPLKMFL